MQYVADYETTTKKDDCRVWAFGIVDIDDTDDFTYANSIESFFDWCENCNNATVYFHNLKFDGAFIIDYLFRNEFSLIEDRKQRDTKTFTTLISDMGTFYSIEIYFEVKGKHSRKVKILNSLIILPFKVKEIAKGFGLEESKGDIDYHLDRPIGWIITDEEKEYLRKDCVIVAKALKTLFSQGLEKMTQGSNALADYKTTINREFRKLFPLLDFHADIRKSYRGGWTYANPTFKGLDINEGLVFDVNSLYPWVMYECMLPYGEGIYYSGEYQKDEFYDVYIQNLSCQFELKKGYLPTLQLKHNRFFADTEYCISSDENFIDLTLTSVDLKLFLEHYNVYNVTYIQGWKFRSTNILFKDYIDKWIKVKIESTLNGNEAMRTLAKLMLNALYGKFALNPRVCSKYPKFDEMDNRVKYYRGQEEFREPMYMPIGTFITSYAREKTIRSAQILMNPTKQYPNGRFLYADTDSLHIIGLELPKELEISPTILGAWKMELQFTRARYLRAKCYIEEFLNKKQELELKVTIAGLPKIEESEEDEEVDGVYSSVTWENFRLGSTYKGKLHPVIVAGGIVLLPIDYQLKA